MMRDLTQSSGSHAVSAPRSAAISAAPKSNAAGLMPSTMLSKAPTPLAVSISAMMFVGLPASRSSMYIEPIVAEESHFGKIR
jgi:hypothetical protein